MSEAPPDLDPEIEHRPGRVGLWWARAKAVIIHRVLGVQDTPHRIAWGMAIGTVIAFTPTIGLQIMLYLAAATLLRANKISGVPVLFISNPVSAVPLYWACWRFGAFLMGSNSTSGNEEQLQGALDNANANAAETSLWEDIWTSEFWEQGWETMKALGGELWLGSLVIGVALAIPAYFVTHAAVRRWRKREKRKTLATPSA